MAFSLFQYLIGELPLDGGDHNLVSGEEFVDFAEGGAVGRAVPGYGRVAFLAGKGGGGIVAGALAKIADPDSLNDGLVNIDAGNLDPGYGRSLIPVEHGQPLGMGFVG